MGEENPGEVPEQLVLWDHGETDENEGREADIEDEDVDVFCGASALAVPRFELKGFIFSETVRKKDWMDTLCLRVLLTPLASAISVFKSSNYTINLSFRISCRPVIEFCRLVTPRALKLEDDFVRLLCFSVWLSWGTICSSGCLRDLSDWCVGIRVWSCCSHFGGRSPERRL